MWLMSRFTARWDELSPFEKLCWGWQAENRYMREHADASVRLEDITESYDLFQQLILQPLAVSVGRTHWEEAVEIPLNATKTYSVQTWEQWPARQQALFADICGDEMRRYGYTVSRKAGL